MLGITRSIPIPEPGLTDSAPVREAILEIARTLEPYTDGFMTDTLRGYGGEGRRPARGRLRRHYRRDLRLGSGRRACRGEPNPRDPGRGISPENVRDAVGRVRPAGIDSCTQTNARDNRGRPIRFRKDFDRVGRLLAEVRKA